jgi:hypothetical protein
MNESSISPSDLYLTEERIRAVVRDAPFYMKKARSKAGRTTMLSVPETLPNLEAGETLINVLGDQIDAVVGPGGGRWMADNTRLLWLLSVLAKGTREEALATEELRWRRLAASGLAPALIEGMRVNAELHERRIRGIPQFEIDAVMSCLDLIQPLYPGQVKDDRIRHTAVDDTKLRQAAAALRTGDSSRPQLTEERIQRILAVLGTLVPVPKKLLVTLGESPYALVGKTAADLFPATTLKKIRAQGEDAEDFARDLVWLRMIVTHFKFGESLDDVIAGMLPRNHAQLWIEVALAPQSPERAERLAAMTWRQLDWATRIGRGEEKAVKSLLPEIQRGLRPHVK